MRGTVPGTTLRHLVIWFALRNGASFRFCEPIVQELHARGHSPVVSFALGADGDVASAVRAAGGELVPFAVSSRTRTARWADRHRTLAGYVTLRRRWPPLLRERWLEFFPAPLVRLIRLVDGAGLSAALDSRRFAAALRSSAGLWPVARAARRQLRELRPDLVVASPLIVPGSNEVEAIRAAKAAGVATAALVLSWDNLTSKGLLQVVPDRVLVWNESQVREAVEWHGLEPGRLDVVGAPVYDYLFARRGRADRTAALDRLGLPADARYVLWAGSSKLALGVDGEARIAAELAAALAAARWPDGEPPRLVVRPHPTLLPAWEGRTVAGVTVEPSGGFPASAAAQDELAAVVGNADAVVGLNTSLFLDAAVLGVPTIALTPADERSPASLVHFEHLVRGGFVSRAVDLAGVVDGLVGLRRDGDRLRPARDAFVAAFLRPCGLDRPAAACAAERLASIA